MHSVQITVTKKHELTPEICRRTKWYIGKSATEISLQRNTLMDKKMTYCRETVRRSMSLTIRRYLLHH